MYGKHCPLVETCSHHLRRSPECIPFFASSSCLSGTRTDRAQSVAGKLKVTAATDCVPCDERPHARKQKRALIDAGDVKRRRGLHNSAGRSECIQTTMKRRRSAFSSCTQCEIPRYPALNVRRLCTRDVQKLHVRVFGSRARFFWANACFGRPSLRPGDGSGEPSLPESPRCRVHPFFRLPLTAASC